MKKQILCALALSAALAAAILYWHSPLRKPETEPIVLATPEPGAATPEATVQPPKEPRAEMSPTLSLALRAYGSPSGYELRTVAACESLKSLQLSRMDRGTISVDLCEIARVFPNLEYLYIYGIPVEISGELAGFAKLESLTLHRCELEDCTGLSTLASLRSLNLTNNPLSSVAPLAGLAALEALNLSDCCVSDVQPLQGLSRLRKLNLSRNPVADLTPLTSCPVLIELEA